VKNMLYRRTDEVERLQKLIGDTERQFVDCLLPAAPAGATPRGPEEDAQVSIRSSSCVRE
jgi:hypothetical protein